MEGTAGPRESSKGPTSSSHPGRTTAGNTGGPWLGRGSWQVGCVQTWGKGQSQLPRRAGRVQPLHVTGMGGAAVGRRDGAPGGVSGSEACVLEPPGKMLLRRLVTGFRGPGGGARLDTQFTMDCEALGLREGTWDRGPQGESLGAPTRRGQEGRGKAPRTESAEAGVRRGAGQPPGSRVGKPPKEEGDISQPRDELVEPIRQNPCAGTPWNGPDGVLQGGPL